VRRIHADVNLEKLQSHFLQALLCAYGIALSTFKKDGGYAAPEAGSSPRNDPVIAAK
jgi:hypothetical protein